VRQKRKLTFFSVLPPFRGGIAQFSEELRKSLDDRAIVQAFTFNQQYPDFLFPGQSQFDKDKTDFEFPRVVSTVRPWTYFRALKRFKRSNPEIFLTNYWMSFFGPMMGFWARFLPKKTVKIALVHNLIPHEKRFFDQVFNRYFVHSYDGFILLSESVEQEVKQLRPDARTCVLKHPSYHQYGQRLDAKQSKSKLGLSWDKKTILFFGLIRSYKGLDLLLEAFSMLDDSYQLVIAGEIYGDRSIYDALISTSKNKQIVFHDYFISNDALPVYFSAADLCVLPYRSATQSGIKATCDAFSLPVLVSRVGGLSEEIIAGENGFVMNAMTAESLAKQIDEITSSTTLKQVSEHLQLQQESSKKEWGIFADAVLDFSRQIEQSKN